MNIQEEINKTINKTLKNPFSYIRSLGKEHSNTTSSFVAVPEAGSFVTQSSPIHKNRGKVATGVEFKTTQNALFGLNYSYEFATKYSAHNLLADVRYVW